MSETDKPRKRTRKNVAFGVVVRQIAEANGTDVTSQGKTIRRWIRANYDDAQRTVFAKNEKANRDKSPYGDVTPNGVKVLKSRFVKASK